MLTFLSLTCGFCLKAQTSLILQPGAVLGQDAEIFNLEPNLVQVTEYMRADATTDGDTVGIRRNFIKFDFSSIPKGSTIDSAFLSFYSPDPAGNEGHLGDNTAYIKRVITLWEENRVKWVTQPLTTDENQVILPASTSAVQDYKHIDVTAMTRDMLAKPSTSFGYMLMLADESAERRMTFASSDYADSDKHPKIEIYYTAPTCTTVVIRPGEEGKDHEVYSLQPNVHVLTNLFRGAAWKLGQNPYILRGLLEFDLSVVPAGKEIDFAYLSLYSPDFPTTEDHEGPNAALLQRITSAWEEATVTWNTQPTTTTENEIRLDSSLAEYQDYINIDVTQLVKDMIAHPDSSFGFLIRMEDEEVLRRMSFASSDYPNVQKHPKLEICYQDEVSVDHGIGKEDAVDVYPNPCVDWVQINLAKQYSSAQLQIIDYMGRTISESKLEHQSMVDVSLLQPSMYVFRIITDQHDVIATKIVVKQ